MSKFLKSVVKDVQTTSLMMSLNSLKQERDRLSSKLEDLTQKAKTVTEECQVRQTYLDTHQQHWKNLVDPIQVILDYNANQQIPNDHPFRQHMTYAIQKCHDQIAIWTSELAGLKEELVALHDEIAETKKKHDGMVEKISRARG